MHRKTFLASLVSLGLAACGGGSIGDPETIGCMGDGPCPRPSSGEIDAAALSIDDLQAGYASKRFSAEDITRAYLRRIDSYDAAYNAFTTRAADAIEQARAIDQRRARGEALGPLAGVPVVIKESMDAKGMPSTAGWAAMSQRKGGVDFFPADNAVVVLDPRVRVS